MWIARWIIEFLVDWVIAPVWEYTAAIFWRVFNPARFIDVAIEHVFDFAAFFTRRLGHEDFSDRLETISTVFSSEPVQRMVGLVVFFFSPICSPLVLLGALNWVFAVWLTATFLKLVLNLKSHIWSAPS